MTEARCTCSDSQLHFVGCVCDAECLAGAELDRRFDAETARMVDAEVAIAAQQAVVDAAMAAEHERFISEDAAPLDEDGVTFREMEAWTHMALTGEGA